MRVALVGLMGCSGFVGDPGVFECPLVPESLLAFDEPVPSLELAVRDFALFAASPARATLNYDQGGSTGLSFRFEPLEALVRPATNPVVTPPQEARCE
ncbi:MAG: hypothetical protein AAF211_31395, partial [Myxococcota bacterium]